MNIALLDVDGFQTCFGSVQFSSFCFWEHRVSLYSLCFKGEFQRYFEGFYMCFTCLSRTKKYLCARSQLSTKNKTLQLIRFTRRTETTTDLKSVSNKTAATLWTYQRRICYSIKLKEPQFTTAVTNKIKPNDATINPLKHNLPGIDSSNLQGNGHNTDRFFWMNKVSDVSLWNSEQACSTLCSLHTAWHLSLGSYHTETHHYPPLLVLIKIIIAKFFSKITTRWLLRYKALSKAPNRL